MKAKEIAKELVEAFNEAKKTQNSSIFSQKYAKTLIELIVNEPQALIVARNINTYAAFLPVLKQQRQRFMSICATFQMETKVYDVITGADFDNTIKKIYPNMYDWYVKNIIK